MSKSGASGSQLTSGMVLALEEGLYCIVESSIKVAPAKGAAFIKAKLRDLRSGEIIERNFKPTQKLTEVTFEENGLEFLYLEGGNYCFLRVKDLQIVAIPAAIVGQKASYLKEGIEVTALIHEGEVLAIALPQFLELMIAEVVEETNDEALSITQSTKMVALETGAELRVPAFIEVGDIIKVDTQSNEYIQRV